MAQTPLTRPSRRGVEYLVLYVASINALTRYNLNPVREIVATFFILSTAFAVIDATGILHNFRNQRNASVPSWKRYALIYIRASANLICVVVPSVYAISWLLADNKNECGVLVCSVGMLITDIISYSIHRALHTKRLYFIHKHHHQHHTPVAAATLDAHPLEVLVWDILPISVVPLVFGMSRAAGTAWAVVLFASTICSHSGYNLFMISNSFHDRHHTHSKGNYGAGISDILFKTVLPPTS